MGTVADYATIPPDAWPGVMPSVRAAGVTVTGGEAEGDVEWYACTRGHCRVELGYSPGDRGREVVVYCPARHFWRRPLTTWRLLRCVRRAVVAAGGTLA